MKKLLLVFSIALFANNMNAQKIASENIPATVDHAFKAKFSIAEKTSWEMDYENFKADFSVGKSEFSAIFDKEGKWLETITYLKLYDLPKLVREAISKKYGEFSSYKIEEVVKVENEKGLLYEVEIKKGENIDVLGINEKGEILKEEGKSEKKTE